MPAVRPELGRFQWSRLARPSLQTWVEEDDRLRLVEQAVAKDDPDPKALACYGLLLRAAPTDRAATDELWRRVVKADGLLTINELSDRVSDAYDCPHEPHLAIPEKVA